jgi:site-specific DNA recombinase
MKDAVYLRVSTGLQAIDGYSLDTQLDLCIKKAKELIIDEKNIEVFREEGVSGEDIDRPELNRLRNEVKDGQIRRVICVHPDRLSRDLTDKLIICRELQKYNVELIFVDTEYKNTPEGQLFFNIQSVIAQYELALIRKRTTRGRLEAVKKEKKVMPMRSAPFGYDLVESKLLINEKESEFVKKVYEWYVYEKLTLREIGERLYSLGIQPKRGESKNWSASSIRRILTSEIYIGKYSYNQRQSKKIKGEKTASGKPRKSFVWRDEKDWITIEVPALIDEEIFNLAQEQRIKNTKKSGNQKFDYLFKSLIRCGNCGRIYQATTYSGRENKETGERARYPVYRCPNLFPKKYGPEVERCQSRSIRAELLEDYIWRIILLIIYSPEEIIEEYKSSFTESIDDVERTLSLVLESLKTRNSERERVKQMFVKGFIDEDEMTAEFEKINKEIKKLNEDKEKYQQFIEEYKKNLGNEKEFNDLLFSISKVLDNKSSYLTFKEKLFIVENLIDEIVLTFEPDLETVKVNIFGAAQNILLNKDFFDPESSTQNQKV